MCTVATLVDSEVGRLSRSLLESQQEARSSEAACQETELERQQLQERAQELEGLLVELREEARLQQEQAEQGEPIQNHRFDRESEESIHLHAVSAVHAVRVCVKLIKNVSVTLAKSRLYYIKPPDIIKVWQYVVNNKSLRNS